MTCQSFVVDRSSRFTVALNSPRSSPLTKIAFLLRIAGSRGFTMTMSPGSYTGDIDSPVTTHGVALLHLAKEPRARHHIDRVGAHDHLAGAALDGGEDGEVAGAEDLGR